ncbi:MAG: zinc-ribbon domain containing protein [Candidatus Zixiibacteriota bacterium]
MASFNEPRFLVCVECGEEFVFTANAQDYFAEKGYTEDPKRCKHCYMLHKREKKNQIDSPKTNFDQFEAGVHESEHQ